MARTSKERIRTARAKLAPVAARLASLRRKPKAVIPVASLALVGLPTGIGVAFGIKDATFVLAAYGAAFSAFALLGWRPFRALPELNIALRVGQETLTTLSRSTDRAQAPIDVDACVRERLAAARESVPP